MISILRPIAPDMTRRMNETRHATMCNESCTPKDDNVSRACISAFVFDTVQGMERHALKSRHDVICDDDMVEQTDRQWTSDTMQR